VSVTDDDYPTRLRAILRTRCLHLRTKAACFPFPRPDEEQNPDPTAVWRCGRTCEPLGPDGSAAHPTSCDAPGRRCYARPTND
jgi:hypothetical protein